MRWSHSSTAREKNSFALQRSRHGTYKVPADSAPTGPSSAATAARFCRIRVNCELGDSYCHGSIVPVFGIFYALSTSSGEAWYEKSFKKHVLVEATNEHIWIRPSKQHGLERRWVACSSAPSSPSGTRRRTPRSRRLSAAWSPSCSFVLPFPNYVFFHSELERIFPTLTFFY